MADVRVVSKWLRLSRHPGAMVVLALALLTACQETPTETEDAAPITAARQASPQRPVRPAESTTRFLAASAPEFGGMFLDDNGALVVWIPIQNIQYPTFPGELASAPARVDAGRV